MKGGENPVLEGGTGWKSALPNKGSAVATPNLLLSQARGGGEGGGTYVCICLAIEKYGYLCVKTGDVSVVVVFLLKHRVRVIFMVFDLLFIKFVLWNRNIRTYVSK